jgi:hypothetical protein
MDGGEVAISEGPNGRERWFAGAWVQGGARRLAGGDDVRRLPLHFLVEDILG